MESFFQNKISKLNAASALVNSVRCLVDRVERNAVRKYLKHNDNEKWTVSGKVGEGLIQELRDQVKLTVAEHQETLENLETSKELKKELIENLQMMEDSFESQKSVLEYLKDFRKPMCYDINQTIEFYAREKEEYCKYICNIEGASKKLEESIRSIKESQSELDIMIECQMFLIENSEESLGAVRKTKDKSKTYSIRVSGAENTNKGQERTLEVKTRFSIKPQQYEFSHGFSNDLSTRLLESPISSNNSQDSPIGSSHSSKIISSPPPIKNCLNSPSCKLTSPSNYNLNRQNIERLKMIKKKTEFRLDLSPKSQKNIYLSPPVRNSKDSKNSSNSSLSLSKSIDCSEQGFSSSPQLTLKKSPKVAMDNFDIVKPKNKIISEALNNLKQIF